MKYDFAAIEKKWQAHWEEVKPYAAETGSSKPKFYDIERLWSDSEVVELSSL